MEPKVYSVNYSCKSGKSSDFPALAWRKMSEVHQLYICIEQYISRVKVQNKVLKFHHIIWMY